MTGFVLRVKTKSGQKVVDGLIPQAKVSELKLKLADLTGIPVSALHVLGGFPPKAIDLNSKTATIEESGIVSGDTLIIEEKQNAHDGDQEETNVIGQPHVTNEDRFDSVPMLTKKVVPADNSCLFTSVGYVLNGKVDPSCASFMREIIASTVAVNSDEYSDAFLGRPNAEYCEWILKPDSWGGAIELSILSKFYGIEIAVIDSVSAIINRFGEDQHYAHRVFLIFDGIHYDPLYAGPLKDGSIQTIFPTEDERMLLVAEQLARDANSNRQFTDVQRFVLMCNDCKMILSGQIAAQQHAKETGHQNFGEV